MVEQPSPSRPRHTTFAERKHPAAAGRHGDTAGIENRPTCRTALTRRCWYTTTTTTTTTKVEKDQKERVLRYYGGT